MPQTEDSTDRYLLAGTQDSLGEPPANLKQTTSSHTHTDTHSSSASTAQHKDDKGGGEGRGRGNGTEGRGGGRVEGKEGGM